MSSAVYVARADGCRSKVGMSDSPYRRLAELRGQFRSRQFEVAYVAAVDDRGIAAHIEQRAHAILRDERHSGDWFNVAADVAIDAVSRAALELGYALHPLPKTEPRRRRQRPRIERRPRRSKASGEERVQVRMSKSLVSKVDEWRDSQSGFYSRTEAIRCLAYNGLEAEAQKKKGGRK